MRPIASFCYNEVKTGGGGMALPERDIMEKHLEQTTAFREVLASRGVLVACVGAKLRSFAPPQ